MIRMKSFKNVIIASIERGTYTEEYYKETIAKWLLNGWLTEEEAMEVFVVLEEKFPDEDLAEK